MRVTRGPLPRAWGPALLLLLAAAAAARPLEDATATRYVSQRARRLQAPGYFGSLGTMTGMPVVSGTPYVPTYGSYPVTTGTVVSGMPTTVVGGYPATTVLGSSSSNVALPAATTIVGGVPVSTTTTILPADGSTTTVVDPTATVVGDGTVVGTPTTTVVGTPATTVVGADPATAAAGADPTAANAGSAPNAANAAPAASPLTISIGSQQGYIQHADGSVTTTAPVVLARDAQVRPPRAAPLRTGANAASCAAPLGLLAPLLAGWLVAGRRC